MANWQSIDELQDIASDLPRFTHALDELSRRLGLNITPLTADHISLRCHQNVTAERWRRGFEQCGELLSEKEIPQSYAMAIARQESAWNPKVKSPVGASGLMQIMPGTATHTVKMFSIPGYSSPGQLLDPETNINIGTSYLQYVYQQFGNNRIFSSAAYNAGPGRVRTWLGNSAGRIDAVAFVESIPFSETRGYVKNVLAYDAYYRYFMGDKPTLMSATEWGRRY